MPKEAIMSHFSTLKVQVKDMRIAQRVFQKLNWTPERVDKYVNRWDSREVVNDCTLVKDSTGRVKMVIAPNGDVIHDDFSMGKEVSGFLQQYTEAFIRDVAARDCAQVSNLGTDMAGNIILEVNYAFA
jgi:hypothetical protein